MEDSINVSWAEGMSFETNINGHKIILDADDSVGGTDKGPRPKPLMLVSLAGCTGMDVISILKKMNVKPDSFNVKVNASLTEEHPKYYKKMHIIYEFSGDNLPVKKIKKAVSLSEERYCGVSVVYKKAIQLSSEIKINNETM